MKRILLGIGIVLILAAAVWKFGLSSRWSNRYADQWSWEVQTIGQSGYPDESGEYPEGTTLADDPINLTIRNVTAEADGADAGYLMISDHFESRDTVTNELTWEYTATALVDAEKGQHAEGDFAGDYYFFPRNVDKNTTYTLSNSSYQSLPLTFEQEEVVGGINTYLFAFHGDLDNTAANAAFVELEPDQKVICFDFALEYWVEPTTGEIVKYREWCEGDWIVDASGERVAAISRWGGETSGDDIIRQVNNVQNKRSQYLWTTLYIPVLLALIGVALLVFSLIRQPAATRVQAS